MRCEDGRYEEKERKERGRLEGKEKDKSEIEG